MIFKFMLSCLLLAGATREAFSQTAQRMIVTDRKWKEISVGEMVPDVSLSDFFDDSLRQVRFSELHKNKLLILDFWATTCGGCISEMPYIKSLQQRFKDSVTFLLVCYDKRSTVVACNKRFKIFDDGQ